MNSTVFYPAIISLLVGAVAAKPVLSTLIALKSRQTINKHAPEGHQKKQGTPTMGGIISLIGMAVGLSIAAIQGWGGDSPARVWSMLGLLVLFGIIGFVDDYVIPKMMPGKRGLGWIPKLAMQVPVAAIPWLFTGDFGAKDPLAAGLVVLTVLFFTNAYNFSDGLDGLAGTLLLGIAAFFAGLGLLKGDAFLVMSGTVLAGGIIPFLYLNAPPAKVFMGDVGALAIGAVIGHLFAYVFSRGAVSGTLFSGLEIVGLAFAMFMMIAELIPVPLQIASVKLFKRKLFPYTPIHHAFEKAGWPETRVVFSFALTQLVCTLIALAFYAGNGGAPWKTP